LVTDLVEAVEDERVAPHDDGDRIVAERQTVGSDEQSLGRWKDPNAHHEQEIDKVAEVSQEVMISSSVVGDHPYGHEVDELCRVPDVEVLRKPADEVAAKEDVHDAANEGYLLPQRDDLCVVPLVSQLLHALAHPLPVSLELLLRRGNSSSPFLNHALPSELAFGLEGFSRPADLFRLSRYALL
jgi:hypothetical protein